MHAVVLKWQAAHKKTSKHIEPGERLCFGFHLLMAKDKAAGIDRSRKSYEGAMTMFGELRPGRALTDEQIQIMRDPARPIGANLPKLQDAVANGCLLIGGANEIIDHLMKLEKRYPGLERIAVSLSVGASKAEALMNLERFAKKIMPVFKNLSMKVEAAE